MKSAIAGTGMLAAEGPAHNGEERRTAQVMKVRCEHPLCCQQRELRQPSLHFVEGNLAVEITPNRLKEPGDGEEVDADQHEGAGIPRRSDSCARCWR